MAKFDKYLLSQLMVLFGFFALVLVMVYWVNRAVILFDQLIANGHSAMVFLEFSALTLPNVIRLVLPIAAFAASLYVANRLAAESELIVVQSTGYSPYRLARPVAVFGVIVGLMLAVLTHVLVPASLTQLEQRKAEIAANATSRFLVEGTFLHPSDGITFYIREIGADGAMSNMFLSDSRDSRVITNYSASRAVLLRSDSGPKLIMLDGLAQVLRLEDQVLSTTGFSEFVFDLGPLLAVGDAKSNNPQQLATRDLIWPSAEIIETTKTDRATLLQMGHERISQSVLSVVVVLIGFSAILMGGFSRFRLWKQIIGAIIILVALKSLDNFMGDVARRNDNNWPLVYLASLVGFVVAYLMLWYSTHPNFILQLRRRGSA